MTNKPAAIQPHGTALSASGTAFSGGVDAGTALSASGTAFSGGVDAGTALSASGTAFSGGVDAATNLKVQSLTKTKLSLALL
jgi:hypothetical protein